MGSLSQSDEMTSTGRTKGDGMESPVYSIEGNDKDTSMNGFSNLGYVDHSETDAHAQIDKTEPEPEESKPHDEFRSLVPFCVFFGIGSLFSSSLNTFLSSQITVIERSFGLSSSESGLLLSANDVGFVATVLFASHFLKNSHIPRILGICVFIFGIAGLLTSLPHFITNEKMPTHDLALRNTTGSQTNSMLCHPHTALGVNDTLKSCDPKNRSEDHSEDSENNKAMLVLVIISTLMLLQGAMKAPRQALASVFIDNNSERTKTGFYIGLLSSFGIFGPFVAILVGGILNKIPVDLKETNLQVEDPRWIGAWWLGFLIFGACALLSAIPIFFFPASMRKHKPHDDGKLTEYVNASHTDRSSFCFLIKDIPKSVLRVLTTPVYLCNILSLLMTMFAIMVLGSFGPKYIENQFHIPTWKANVVLGLEKLVTTVIGTFAGGVITRRFKLGMVGCLKMLLICSLITTTVHSSLMFLGCERPDIIGFDTQNGFTSNLSCDCSNAPYIPVCADGNTFFSPCHAGCQVELPMGYSNCSAIASGSGERGICDTGCNLLVPFVAVNAFTSLIGTAAIAPSYVVMLRSIQAKDRAMAVGLQSFLLALLVFLPAPIILGKMFDTFCLVWKDNCGITGSCSLYDNTEMRTHLLAVDLSAKAASVVFTIFGIFFAKRWLAKHPAEKTYEMEVKGSKPPVPQPRLSLQNDVSPIDKDGEK